MRILKVKYFVAFALTATVVLIIAYAVCFLINKLRQDSGSNLSVLRSPVIQTFPSADYQPPQVRATRVSSSSMELFTPYMLFALDATNYAGCITALRSLPAELTPEQFEKLRDAITIPFDPSMPFKLLEFNGLRNAAAEFLLQQPDFPSDLLLDFAAMHEDPGQDPVWRDYCLQMLTTGWLNLAERSGEESSKARTLSVQVLEKAVNARAHPWPGTALLGLRLISDNDPTVFPPESLNRLILDVVTDHLSSESARLTALRLAGERCLAEASATAEALALDPATAPMLRLCAVATLGDLETGRSTLETIVTSSDPTLCAIATQALQNHDPQHVKQR